MLKEILLYITMALYLIQFGALWLLIFAYVNLRIEKRRNPNKNAITDFKEMVKNYKAIWTTFVVSLFLSAMIMLAFEFNLV